MSVAFRNVAVEPSAPVEEWPFEAIVAAIERGGIHEWARITSAMRRDPWGPVARQVEERLSYEPAYGVGPLLHRAIERARRDAELSERTAVAGEVAELIERSGLPLASVAQSLGTSRSRLSTYRSGTVMPSAALLVRLRRIVERLDAQR